MWPKPAVAPKRNFRKLGVILATTAVLITGALAFQHAGVLTGRSQDNRSPITQKASGPIAAVLHAITGQSASPMMQTVASSSPSAPVLTELSGTTTLPTLEKQGALDIPVMPKEALTMPDDVRIWLEHLAKCEAARMALTAAEMGDAAGTLASLQANGGQKTFKVCSVGTRNLFRTNDLPERGK